jgi:hypothetical protein
MISLMVDTDIENDRGCKSKKEKEIFCRFATLRHGDTSVPDGLSR